SQMAKRPVSRRSDFVGMITGSRSGEPSKLEEAVVERSANAAGDMVVAGSRGAQPVRRCRLEFRARSVGEDTESFECPRHLGSEQCVVTMLALPDHGDETLCLQTVEVNARGGRAHTCDDGKLRAGARAIVDQAVQHAGTRWFSDGRGN